MVTRKTSNRKGAVKSTTPKGVVETSGINTFKPSPSQKQALNVVKENVITFITGNAGTGKSSVVLWEYAKQYMVDPSMNIVVIKSPTEAGIDKIGFLPGSETEKIAVHFQPNRKILEDFLSKGKFECDYEKRIHFLVPNYILGRTFDNSLILIEEAQQLQPMLLKLILERTGVNSKVVVVGDQGQLYTDSKESKLRNGLTDAVQRFFNEDGSKKYNNIGKYEFSVEDVMRSDIVKDVIRAYTGE